MRAVSLFSGIGGLDLGLSRAGIETVMQVEVDPACNTILARHFPNAEREADVRFTAGTTCDVLHAGFPCQDASVMRGRHGEREGIRGERTGLFRHVARLAEALSPRWLILENVKGLLSADRGRSFGTVLGSLDDMGYVGEWRVVDGAAFGLPLRREHLIILAFNSKHGDVPEGTWLGDAEDWNTPGPQLLEGTGQPLSAHGRPALGRDYRLLTPEECESGLGFPEGWTSGQSRTVRYKQLGNAVAVPVAEWIGRRLMEVDRNDNLR